MIKKEAVVGVAVVMLWAASAAAQVPSEPDPETARVRIGPILAKPALSLTNAGIDDNVFNESDAEDPKSDFAVTVTPQTELWLGMGRTWVTGSIKKELVWYKKYTNQRSSNDTYSVGWLVPLSRIAFSVGGTWVNTHERPGFEIDARAHRNENAFNGAVEVRAASKTLVGVRGERRQVSFARDAIFLGSNLRDQLNRTQTSAGLTFRYELTPLTSFVVDASRLQDRFEFSDLRDADSTQVTVGLRFDPFALIKGSGQVGFRRYTPLAGDVPGYRGVTAAVNLSYVALTATKLGLQVTRDVQYSHDVDQPYYLLTGLTGSIGQQIYGPLDLEGRLGFQRLSYRDRVGSIVAAPDRRDKVQIWGIGIGYRIGRDLRIAFNVESTERESIVARREYQGLRYGTSVTYGL